MSQEEHAGATVARGAKSQGAGLFAPTAVRASIRESRVKPQGESSCTAAALAHSLGVAGTVVQTALAEDDTGGWHPDLVGGDLDQAAQDGVARQAEDKPTLLASTPSHHLGTAVMTIASDGQPRAEWTARGL
jgi:hypothetical protein